MDQETSAQSNAFVGRKSELLALRRRFDAGARLVTLVGPPGSGKTRLAKRFALELAPPASREEARFVDLTSASTAHDLVQAVAHALRVPLVLEDTEDLAASRLAHALAARGKALVVLDNFEQLIATGGAVLAAWMTRATEARFLVTSRERTGIAGENGIELGPLPSEQAVELFVTRARAVRLDFSLSKTQRSIVDGLVERLDRIPLAIELAAAHADVLGPAELLQRLDARFDILRDDRRAAEGKLATLERAIDWSWGLLDDAEKRALARCSLFEGSFTVAAAEAILEGEDAGALSPLAAIQSLRNKSLLYEAGSPAHAPELRLAMYESIRAFARAKLEGRPDARAATETHTAFYVVHAAEWGRLAEGPKAAEALGHLEADLANMIAVIRRDGAELAAASILIAVEPLFRTRGPLGLYVALLDRTLDALVLPERALVRAWLSCVRGGARAFAWRDEAKGEALAVILVAQRHGDAKLEALALQNLAEHLRQKEPREALARLEEATRIARRVPNARLEGSLAMSLAQAQIGLARDVGELEAPQDTLERALTTFRKGGCRALEGVVLDRIGDLHWHRGEFARAKTLHEDALRVHREVGNRWAEGVALDHLSGLLLELGLVAEALPRNEEALAIHRATGNRFHEQQALWTRGQILQEIGKCKDAEACYVAALAIDDASSVRATANLSGYLGIVLFEEGRLPDAEARLEDAVASCREAFPTREGFFSVYLAAVKAELDQPDEARRVFEEGMARVRETGDAKLAACLAPLEAFVDRALARSAREHGDDAWADERMQKARARLPPEDAQVRVRLEARPGLRVLRRVSERVGHGDRVAAESAVGTVLTIAPGGLWFRLGEGARVDLAKREPLRLLVEALASSRERAPGTALSVAEMVRAGWPADATPSHAGVLRLYTAVRRLRNLGLRKALRTTHDGYFLDAAVPMERAEGSTP